MAAGSYHSVLFVGYRTSPKLKGGGEFISHDSGRGRSARMSFAEASRRLNDIFYVRSRPKPWWRSPAN